MSSDRVVRQAVAPRLELARVDAIRRGRRRIGGGGSARGERRHRERAEQEPQRRGVQRAQRRARRRRSPPRARPPRRARACAVRRKPDARALVVGARAEARLASAGSAAKRGATRWTNCETSGGAAIHGAHARAAAELRRARSVRGEARARVARERARHVPAARGRRGGPRSQAALAVERRRTAQAEHALEEAPAADHLHRRAQGAILARDRLEDGSSTRRGTRAASSTRDRGRCVRGAPRAHGARSTRHERRRRPMSPESSRKPPRARDFARRETGDRRSARTSPRVSVRYPRDETAPRRAREMWRPLICALCVASCGARTAIIVIDAAARSPTRRCARATPLATPRARASSPRPGDEGPRGPGVRESIEAHTAKRTVQGRHRRRLLRRRDARGARGVGVRARRAPRVLLDERLQREPRATPRRSTSACAPRRRGRVSMLNTEQRHARRAGLARRARPAPRRAARLRDDAFDCAIALSEPERAAARRRGARRRDRGGRLPRRTQALGLHAPSRARARARARCIQRMESSRTVRRWREECPRASPPACAPAARRVPPLARRADGRLCVRVCVCVCVGRGPRAVCVPRVARADGRRARAPAARRRERSPTRHGSVSPRARARARARPRSTARFTRSRTWLSSPDSERAPAPYRHHKDARATRGGLGPRGRERCGGGTAGAVMQLPDGLDARDRRARRARLAGRPARRASAARARGAARRAASPRHRDVAARACDGGRADGRGTAKRWATARRTTSACACAIGAASSCASRSTCTSSTPRQVSACRAVARRGARRARARARRQSRRARASVPVPRARAGASPLMDPAPAPEVRRPTTARVQGSRREKEEVGARRP